jgi:hypothetical protein
MDTKTCEAITELLKKDMTKEDLESLINYLQQLSHELGNGTLTRLKQNNTKCKDMVVRIGELNDLIGERK